MIKTPKQSRSHVAHALAEAWLIDTISHRNIIALLDMWEIGAEIHLVLEHGGIDLQSIRTDKKILLTSDRICLFAMQLLKALNFLHVRGVTHNNICARHVLIANDEPRVRLCDFRSASSASAARLDDLVAGLAYAPPDILMGARVVSPAVDIWGFGAVFAEMIIGKVLHSASDCRSTIAKIFRLWGTPPLSEMDFWQSMPAYHDLLQPCVVSPGLPDIFQDRVGRGGCEVLSHACAVNPCARVGIGPSLVKHAYFSAGAAPPGTPEARAAVATGVEAAVAPGHPPASATAPAAAPSSTAAQAPAAGSSSTAAPARAAGPSSAAAPAPAAGLSSAAVPALAAGPPSAAAPARAAGPSSAARPASLSSAAAPALAAGPPSAAALALAAGPPSAAAPAAEATGSRSVATGSTDWKHALATEGYVVCPGLVSATMANKGANAIRGRVRSLLRGYGLRCSQDCRELMDVGESIMRAPAGWEGRSFGAIDKRGWIRKVGNGRMFDDWKNQVIDDIREQTRAHIAEWHRCDPDALTARAERCSVKVPGCGPLPPHLDQGRVDSIQVGN